MTEKHIVAIEIGSSKITGAVGMYDSDKTLKVIAVDQEESKDSVRYGIIHNPEEVASRVRRLLEKLSDNTILNHRKIRGLYVGLSGRSMRSVSSKVKLEYPEVTEFTGEILDNLRKDAKESIAVQLDSNQEILAVVSRSYKIDGIETSSPRGAMGKSISAVYDVIIARTELRRNIQRALTDRIGAEVENMFITPLATADIMLTDEEKRLGCMMVDFGAETTSVSIYRKGSLCYFVTLPLGGRNITRDLTTLPLLEEKAEEIKCESGRAIARETPSTLNLGGIKLSDVSNLVVARAEEIVANVIEQIYYAGLVEKDLPGGIVCVGAAANLHGMLELLQNQSGLNARMGRLPSSIEAIDPKAKRHDNIQAIALLYAAAQQGGPDCLEQLQKEEEVEETTDIITKPVTPEPQPTSDGKVGKFFKDFSKKFSNLFATGVDEDSELD